MTLQEAPDPVRPVPAPVAPRRRTRLVLFSVLAGAALAVLWSFELVDSVIGANVANTLLGRDAKATAIGGTTAGLLFAFVSGFAGTFTACNIAMAASLGPMTQANQGAAGRGLRRAVLRPVGLMTLGMLAVSATYGFVGVLLGDRLPQVSDHTVGDMPVRIIQSSVVFGVIGLAMAYLGLAALGVLPDMFARRPASRVVFVGALVGGFLIGRPYPLFNKLFHWAIDSGNPLYGALSFALQSLGNIVVVTLLFAVLAFATRGRFLEWMRSGNRAAVVTGALFLALGVFTVVYWDLRVPANFGIGWFPSMPYD